VLLTVKLRSVILQEFMANAANDSRSSSTKAPLAPATKGLKGLMHKLGGLNARHEALVRRVDELEVLSTSLSGFLKRYIAFYRKPISKIRSVTCHMESHRVSQSPIQVVTS